MKMMKRLLLFFAVALAAVPAVAQGYTVRGTVRASSSGETLISATVYDAVSGKGVLTNAEGRYSLTLPKGEVRLRVSYVGYQTYYDTFLLDANKELNVSLEASTQLRTVTVTADRVSSHRSSQISAVDVPVEHIKAVPVLFGESDVLKALQLLPGVQSGTEGTSGIYVRGGGPDQNLFLLDGVPLYNVNHLGGFFSAFNADAIKNVTLYKGSFPARFSGRLSSVLDVTSNDGNNKEYHGNITVGDIAAKVNLEGPLFSENTTFNVSYRRTYFDLLLQPTLLALGASEGASYSAGYYFYDLNAKVTHRFSDRSRLIGSWYSGDDKIYAKVKSSWGYGTSSYEEALKMGYKWGNMVGSLRWNYELTPRLFMNVTGAYTRYRNDVDVSYEDYCYGTPSWYSEEQMTYKSGIRDVTAKVHFDYQPTPDHAVKFGGGYIFHIFQPDISGMRIEDTYDGEMYLVDTVIGESKVLASEMYAFIEDDWNINDALKVNCGVNITGFAVQGRLYPSLQPRLSGRWMLSDDLSLKVGYSYMTQYMHQLSNSSISLPTDLWVPVTMRIEPMYAHQVAAGVFYNLKGLVDLSAEAYYKNMNNMLEYKDGASFFGSSTGWEDKVCMGDGWSYGLEVLAQRNIGAFTGWVGYTWSRTMRQFDREGQTINNGEPFSAKYDRRHDISVMLSYKPNKKFDCSAVWVYSSGNVGTLAMHEFVDPTTGEVVPYIESRNNFRMPAYHRLDVGMNFHKEKKHGVSTWSISVYNLYNRKNPFIVYEKGNTHSVVNGVHYSSSLMQLSLFPIIPSVSYNFKF